MDHLKMSEMAYFTHLLAEAEWPIWWHEMPVDLRGAVESWLLAAYLIGIETTRRGAGLTQGD